MVDVSKFGKRDAKIIRDNEGKSPYELLELGLSQAGYDQLINMDSKPVEVKDTTAPKEVKADKAASNVVQPSSVKKINNPVMLTSPTEYKQQKVKAQSGSVKILNKRTGRIISLSVSAANRLLKSPNDYQLV